MPRALRHHGAYVPLAIASLALSVGATLVVFTVVNALWLKRPPLPEPERLVTVIGEGDSPSRLVPWFTNLESEPWTAFEDVAGQVITNSDLSSVRPHLVLSTVGREVETLAVTSRYFGVLGVRLRGRDFTRDDNRSSSEPVAIISERLWAREFGRRDDILGEIVPASPMPVRIIGVAPADFHGARRGEFADLWIPSELVRRISPAAGAGIAEGDIMTFLIARLHPGQTAAEAKRRLVEAVPVGSWRDQRERWRVVSLSQVFGTPDASTIVVSEGRAATVTAGLAALVLFGGCMTLMALVLVHYERRRRELSVRLALGASHQHLAMQLAGELSWIAIGGTAGAVSLSSVSLKVLPALRLPGGVDLGRLDLSLDWTVLGVGILVAIGTLVVAAILPLIRSTDSRIAGELVAFGSTMPPSSHRLRQTLLALQVAATIVVLIAAGLFVRAVLHGYDRGPGYDVSHTVFVNVQLVPLVVNAGGTGVEAALALAPERSRQLEAGLRTLGGVEMVAAGPALTGPLASYMDVPRTVGTDDGHQHELRFGSLRGGPGLIDALGIPVVAGRRLTAADAVVPQPALVTASMARELWPDANPIGQGLYLGGRSERSLRSANLRIVGVTADFVQGSQLAPTAGVIVTVDRSSSGISAAFVVRAERPDLMIEPIQRLVRDVAPDAVDVEVSTARDLVGQDIGSQRLGAWFFSGFGLVALALGAGGVSGLIACLAESRRREFGVRLALGATPTDLVRRSMLAGLVPVATGAVIGLVVAPVVSQALISMLPGLSPFDSLTYLGVAGLTMSCAVFFGYLAARRLRWMTPAEVLRASP
jgi:predicted permease